MRVILQMLLFVMFCKTGTGAMYYISPKGNDKTGDGSYNRPWQSLYRATSVVQKPGDIIHVMAGEYVEKLTCVLAVGVSIEGEGQETTFVKSTVETDWTAIVVASSDKEGTAGNQHISNLTFDGQSLKTAWAIIVSGRSNVSIKYCTIKDFRNRGVTFTGRIDNKDAAPDLYAVANRFHNNIMINCAEFIPGSYGTGCLNIGGQREMLIYNNTITQTGRKEGNNGWPVKYVNNGYIKGCKIYNNKLIKRSMGFNAAIDGWDFAIELSNSSGLEIFGNTIQGSIDLNMQTKDSFEYSVWIHDNTISQPDMNKYMETGITLEYSTEAAIIENNRLTNLGIPLFFTPRDGNILKDIFIRNNICENIGVADGSHKGGGIRIGEDGNRTFYMDNFVVNNNKLIGSPREKPYWGISILGLSGANKIQIKGNTLENFSAGFVNANPASVIESMVISGNRLSNNGFANRAAFYEGSPKNFSFADNVSVKPSIFTATNIKMNVVRPVYYSLKNGDMLVLIAFLIVSIGLYFLIREHIFGFPVLFLFVLIGTLLSLEKEYWGETGNYILMATGTGFGWIIWSKRVRGKHRLVRITRLQVNERLKYILVFLSLYLLSFLAHYFLPEHFAAGSVPWADAFVTSASLTGLWLIANKKVTGWACWMLATLFAFPLYFVKHFQVVSLFFAFLFLLCTWGFIKWKQIEKKVKTKKHSKITAL